MSVDSSQIQNEQVKVMALQDQWVFQFVTHICNGNKLEAFQQSLKQSFKIGSDLWTLDTTRLQKFYSRRLTGQYIEIIFSSLALPYALQHCFRNLPAEQQESARNRFIVELIVMDYIGNTIGLVGSTVVISKLFGAIFSGLNKVAWSPLKNQMQKRWKLSDYHLKWLDRVTIYGAVIGTVGYNIHDRHKTNLENKNEEAHFYQSQIKNLVEINEMLEKIELQMMQTNEKEFWESAFMNMNQHKRQLCRTLTEQFTLHYSKDKATQVICEAL